MFKYLTSQYEEERELSQKEFAIIKALKLEIAERDYHSGRIYLPSLTGGENIHLKDFDEIINQGYVEYSSGKTEGTFHLTTKGERLAESLLTQCEVCNGNGWYREDQLCEYCHGYGQS